jgi:hypothetical protein
MTLIEVIEKKNGKWNSLTQLKEYIESNTKEKIKSFDGIYLVTNKYTYSLYDGTVFWRK